MRWFAHSTKGNYRIVRRFVFVPTKLRVEGTRYVYQWRWLERAYIGQYRGQISGTWWNDVWIDV